jgi:hypothetical protein
VSAGVVDVVKPGGELGPVLQGLRRERRRALNRLARAFAAIREFDEARDTLGRVLDIDPTCD